MIGLVVFVVAVVGFAVGLSSARLAQRVGDRAARLVSRAKHLLRKAPVKWNGTSFVRFRAETIVLIRRRWLFLTAATLAGHLTVFLVLLASLRAVGIERAEVTIVEAFAAWALARILGVDPDHAGRRRLRRAGPDGRPRRVRGDERRGRHRDADLPLPDRRAHARGRPACGGDVEGRATSGRARRGLTQTRKQTAA